MTSAIEELPAEAAPALRPAGFWIRAGARFVDWIVLVVVSFVAGVVLIVAAAIREAMGGAAAAGLLETLEQATWVGWMGSLVAALAYHAVFEGIAGSTAGKRVLRLHVIGMDGTPVRFKQAVRRSVAILVDGLFFGAIGAGEMHESPEKQRIGDRWGGTRVVYLQSLPGALRPHRLRFLAALVAAVKVAGLITMVTMIVEYSMR